MLAVAMAWTRTYLHVHWLTDVIGGLCVGLGVGLFTLAWATATDRSRGDQNPLGGRR